MPQRAFVAVPHFTVRDISGREVRYRDIWQHDHLVLVVLPADASDPDVERWEAIRQELTALGARLVITRDEPAAGAAPSVLVADRWGEVVFAWPGEGSSDHMPGPDAVLEWMDWVARRCPECEGEAQ